MKSTARKIKEKFFHPTPVFGQLVSLVKQANVEGVIRKANVDKHSKKIQNKRQTLHHVGSCYLSNKVADGLVCLVSHQYPKIKPTDRTSTREIQLGLVFGE